MILVKLQLVKAAFHGVGAYESHSWTAVKSASDYLAILASLDDHPTRLRDIVRQSRALAFG